MRLGEIMPPEDDLEIARKNARNNRKFIVPGGECGCFHCLRVFPSNRILEWIDNGETALCPICGIDGVLSSNTSSVTPEFLRLMHDRWFKKANPAAPKE